MKPIRDFIAFLNAKAHGNNANAQASPTPKPSVGSASSGPAAQPAPTTKSSSAAQGSHHIERQKMAFRQVSPNDVIDSEEKQWRQNGGTMEGDTLMTRVITSDGQLADPSELRSVCSQCNRMLDTVIRSDISQLTLCRICQCAFEMPDGRKVICTQQEFIQLSYQFDTWAQRDFKRKGGTK